MPKNDETLDPAVLDNLRELERASPGLLKSLTTVFLEETESRLKRMNVALTEQDASGLARLAHETRGSAGNVGVHRMAAVSEEIERAAGCDDLAAAGERLTALEVEFARARESIAALAKEV